MGPPAEISSGRAQASMKPKTKELPVPSSTLELWRNHSASYGNVTNEGVERWMRLGVAPGEADRATAPGISPPRKSRSCTRSSPALDSRPENAYESTYSHLGRYQGFQPLEDDRYRTFSTAISHPSRFDFMDRW